MKVTIKTRTRSLLLLALGLAFTTALSGCSTFSTAGPAKVSPATPPTSASATPVITPTTAPTATDTPTPSATPSVAPTTAPADPVSITWVGDMVFGTPTSAPPQGAGSLLSNLAPTVLQSNVTLGNLETAIGDNLPLTKCATGETDCYAFETPTSTPQMLKSAGFSGVNVANNHTLDAGYAGETSTNTALQAAGLVWAGRPGQITYFTRNGVTIALLGFAPYGFDDNALNIPAAQAQVKKAKAKASIVIVMTHLGAEGDTQTHVGNSEEYYLGEDRGNPKTFSHAMIDAGASLVIGSGPHVLRGMEWYKGHLIAYSLGDFCAYYNLPIDSVTSISAALHVTLNADGSFVSGSVTPLRIMSPGKPKVDPTNKAIGFMNKLSQSDFAGNAATISPSGTITGPQ